MLYDLPKRIEDKGQWRGALMFSLICAWINGCGNNREAGDLRLHRAHYDVTAMLFTHGPESESALACKTKICHTIFANSFQNFSLRRLVNPSGNASSWNTVKFISPPQIYIRDIFSQEMLQPSIPKMCFETVYLKFHSYFREINTHCFVILETDFMSWSQSIT